MEAPATRTQPLVGGGAHLPELGSGLNAPTAPIAPPGADAVVSTTQCAQGVSLTLKSDCDASVTEAAAAKQDVTVPTSAVQGLVAHSGGDPEISMMVVTAEPTGAAMFDARTSAVPATDVAADSKPQSLGTSALLSPQPARTPLGNGALQVPHTVSPADPLLSPPRTLLKAAPMASPIPPPSAGKREVNEAAMALTWLAEAFTAAPVSPVPPRAPTAAADALLLADTGVPGQRGRRAASQRCTSIIREALQIERDTVHGPRIPGLEGTRATKRGKKEGEAGEKRPRGYSQNSRVGRAMMAILKYITKHQPRYMATSAGGVPERIIRNEFGNNPDTSKALRFLVTENKIVRGGQGGRRDPFSYTLATASPAASAEENAGDPGHGHSAKDTAAAQALVAATPAVIAMQADSATAAAAALAAPSTGKLPAPLARQGSRRKPLQPRLSLDLDLAVAVHREVDEEARRAAAATVGAKRPASVAFTPQPATLAPPAMRPSAALETAVAATPKPPTGDASAADAGGDVTTVAAVQSLIKGGKEGMLPPSTIMAPKLTIPDLNGTPVLAPINDRFAHWPSQLPTTQRLSAVASPPAAHTAAQQTGGHTPGSGVFLFPSPSGQMVAAPPNAQAAYLLQLQAAQMYWQQMAAQQHGRTPLGAGPVPPMPAAIPSAVAGPPAVAATPPV